MNPKNTAIFIIIFFLIFSGGLLVGYGTCVDDIPNESHGVSLYLITFGCLLTALGGHRLFRVLRESSKRSAAVPEP